MIDIYSGFRVNNAMPIDNRLVVGLESERNAIKYKYDGLEVFQIDTRKKYRYNLITNTWSEIGDINVIEGAANYIPIFNNNLRLSNSILYQNDNKIGFGTTNPRGIIQIGVNGLNIETDRILFNAHKDTSNNYVQTNGFVISGNYSFGENHTLSFSLENKWYNAVKIGSLSNVINNTTDKYNGYLSINNKNAADIKSLFTIFTNDHNSNIFPLSLGILGDGSGSINSFIGHNFYMDNINSYQKNNASRSNVGISFSDDKISIINNNTKIIDVTNNLINFETGKIKIDDVIIEPIPPLPQSGDIGYTNSLKEQLAYLMGLQGNSGMQGVQGFAGTQGNIGMQGLQGIIGLQGLQGLVGYQGLQGNSNVGLQGLQGMAGVQGITGLQGFQGSSSNDTNFANTNLTFNNSRSHNTNSFNFSLSTNSTTNGMIAFTDNTSFTGMDNTFILKFGGNSAGFRTSYLTAFRLFQMPNLGGTIPLTVNNNTANSVGNIVDEQWSNIYGMNYLSPNSPTYSGGLGIHTGGGFSTKTQVMPTTGGNTPLQSDTHTLIAYANATYVLVLPDPSNFIGREVIISNNSGSTVTLGGSFGIIESPTSTLTAVIKETRMMIKSVTVPSLGTVWLRVL